ncbi:PREDICTED: venom allergen 3-like isoform X2 [Vollenhovia emeryi]|uniref:venom allergen 3-like isoform X2 n=1 Tax=Vollenhovia emeryi TaxID=411798 RepID=UPI0005F52066|nr:PREDICTED: venom allergen 3-like isoform X2 [Vollenhovia emeryi]
MTGICNILCFVTVVTMVTATDYCLLTSCTEKYSHTMCKYPTTIPAKRCDPWYSVGLNDVDRKAMLDKHNELRRKVASGQETRGRPGPQPSAVSMPDLTWDEELENIAQRWVIQCDYGWDKCRNVDRFAVGQNIAMVRTTGKPPSNVEMVKLIYRGVDEFDKNKASLPYQFDLFTVQYTQVVWANTTTVGCGQISSYYSGMNMTYVVCNYGPRGNVIGDLIYKVKV